MYRRQNSYISFFLLLLLLLVSASNAENVTTGKMDEMHPAIMYVHINYTVAHPCHPLLDDSVEPHCRMNALEKSSDEYIYINDEIPIIFERLHIIPK